MVGVASILYFALRWRVLDRIAHNLDEGVYAFQAKWAASGMTPLVDFFIHQPSLYLSGLVTLGADAGVSAVRAPSLVATVFTAWLIFLLGKRYGSVRVGAYAAVVFLGAPLLYFGNLAMPNAALVLLLTAGVWVLGSARSPVSGLAAGALFALAGFVKPLALGPVIGLGVVALGIGSLRRRLLWVLLGGTLTTALMVVGPFSLNDDLMLELFRIQIQRFETATGFQAALQYPPFLKYTERLGVKTALGWNAIEHVRSLFFLEQGNVFLTLAGIVGLVWGAILGGGRARPGIALSVGWLVGAVFFNLFVWEPVWDHYFLLYLPPLALGAAYVAARRPWPDRWRGLPTPVVVIVLACHFAWGYGRLNVLDDSYERLAQQLPELPALSFDPWLIFAAGRSPACRLIDPLNVYGPNSLVARSRSDVFRHFLITRDELQACIETEGPMIILLSYWTRWFTDPVLDETVERQPPELVFHIDDRNRVCHWDHRKCR